MAEKTTHKSARYPVESILARLLDGDLDLPGACDKILLWAESGLVENERLQGRIFRAAHQIVLGDYNEAYHELYQAAGPHFEIQGNPFEQWRKHADAKGEGDG